MESQQRRRGLDSCAHIGDEGPEALHDVGAIVALKHHIQVHEDPLVLFLVPGAPHLLYSTARFGAALMSELRGLGPTWVRVGAHLDSNDMACLPEAHLPHLATGAAAHLPQVLQVIDFRLVALVR